MRATPLVRFLLSRSLLSGFFLCLLFLGGCQTMSAGHGQGAGGGLSSKSVTTDSSPSVLADVKGILDKRGKSEVSPEALLEADGNVNVAQASQDFDPTKAHMQARSNVDTSRKTKSSALAPHFDPDLDEKNDKTFRIVKIEAGDLGKGFSTPPVAQAVSEIEPASGEGAGPSASQPSLQPDAAYEAAGAVIPGRKPGYSGPAPIPARRNGDDTLLRPVSVHAEAPVMPVRKPSVSGETGNPETVAVVEPAAGLVSAVIPGHKPEVPSGSQPDGGGVIDRGPSPRKPMPKPAFMPVKLKPLSAEDERVFTGVNGQNAEILRMRAGEHSGRTRVVLEVRGDVRFEARLDQGRNAVIIDFEGAQWAAGDGPQFHALSVVKGFRVERLPGGGAQIVLDLKKSSKILQAAKFESEKPGVSRVVIDLRNG